MAHVTPSRAKITLGEYYKNGGNHVPACNDATMTDIANTFFSYAKFWDASTHLNSEFSYGGDIYRLWDNNFYPAKLNGKYQMSCSTLTGILLYGITYENSAYGTPGRNILSPLGYQNTDLYNEICFEDSENNLSYWSSQHLCKWCVDKGYAFYPSDDMSDLQPGDILFYNPFVDGSHVNRVFYMQINHSETVAWRINDKKIMVFESGSSATSKFAVRTTEDLQRDLVIAARIPRPNTYSLTYDNLLSENETNATASTTSGSNLLKSYTSQYTLKANHVYTLICHINVADITRVYPYVTVNPAAIYGLGYDSLGGATKKNPNDIYLFPFCPKEDTNSVVLRMRHNDELSVGTSTVDRAMLVEGLVTKAPQWFFGKADNYNWALPIDGSRRMSGNLRGGTSEGHTSFSISNQNETGALNLYGYDLDETKGAKLALFAKNSSNDGGHFTLQAHDGTTSVALIGRPNKSLTWDGNKVMTEAVVGTKVTSTVSAKTIGTSATQITTISLPAGTWVVNGHVDMEKTNAGRNSICINTTTTYTPNTEGSTSVEVNMTQNRAMALNTTRILTVTSTTTVYLLATAAASATSGSCHLTAVRIA